MKPSARIFQKLISILIVVILLASSQGFNSFSIPIAQAIPINIWKYDIYHVFYNNPITVTNIGSSNAVADLNIYTATNQLACTYTFSVETAAKYTVPITCPSSLKNGHAVISSTEPMKVVIGHAWTIMYYLDGDNDLGGMMDNILNQIKSNSISQDVNIVAARLRPMGIASYYHLLDDNNLKLEKILTNTYANRYQSLVSFFTWANQNYPSDHVALVLADHGSGLSGSMFAVSNKNTHLSLKDMRQAFTEITTSMGRKIDVLDMVACLMGLIEDGYEFRNYVDYYVASENIYTFNFNEEDFSEIYNQNISINTQPKDLAISFTNKYGKELGSLDWTISVADLNKSEDVAMSIKQLVIDTKSNLTANAPILKAAFENVQRFDVNADSKYTHSDDYYGDLYNLAELIQSNSTIGSNLYNDAQNIINSIANNYIIYEKHSSSQDIGDSHGVSIFIPDKSRSFYDGTDCEFATGTNWFGMPLGSKLTSTVDDPVGWGNLLVSYFAITQPNGPDDPTFPPLIPLQQIVSIFLPSITR